MSKFFLIASFIIVTPAIFGTNDRDMPLQLKNRASEKVEKQKSKSTEDLEIMAKYMPSTFARIGKKRGFDIGCGTSSRVGVNCRASLNYFLSRDTIIGFKLGGYNQGDSVDRTDYEIHSRGLFFGSAFKTMHANSFYTQFAIDLEYGEGDLQWNGSPTGNEVTVDLGDYSRLNLDFQIGNQWQWESFTLGVDWIGYNFALFSKNNRNDFVASDNYSMIKINGQLNNILSTWSVTLLNFYLGVNF